MEQECVKMTCRHKTRCTDTNHEINKFKSRQVLKKRPTPTLSHETMCYKTQEFRGSNLEGGLKGFENVVKRTSNGAYRSPRRLAVTKHPVRPPPSSIISL